MKYIYLLIVMVIVGCSDKSPKVEKSVLPENTVKVETAKVPNLSKAVETHTRKEVIEAVVPQTSRVVEERIEEKKITTPPTTHVTTMVEEPMVTKNIGSNVPSSCAMWSDGCNVCTRKGGGKASCTTNPECQHKVFSCLQWQ